MRVTVILAGLLLAGSRCLAGEVAPPDTPSPDAAERFACAALKALDLSEAVGTGVRRVEVELLPPAGDQPTLCRANGVLEPEVLFEVRMPVTGWNGKLLVTGCSDFCSGLEIHGMEDALTLGYAAATTAVGNRAAAAGARGTHLATLAAREIVTNYYGNRPGYVYFRGCSTGGRQGLAAAERYPDDYDGIIAGAALEPTQEGTTQEGQPPFAGFKPDLERFRAHGGRLLLYQGWLDETVIPAPTPDYWRELRARLGSDERVSEFTRLVMVPGKVHCGAGPGGTDVDSLTALERWVEADVAP
jgi:hypothetical protein